MHSKILLAQGYHGGPSLNLNSLSKDWNGLTFSYCRENMTDNNIITIQKRRSFGGLMVVAIQWWDAFQDFTHSIMSWRTTFESKMFTKD